MKNASHEGVMIACKAAKVGWPTVSAILYARLAHHVMPEQELIKAKDSFLELTEASAQRTLRFILVQHSARKQAG
jgi:hypothetical protein